MTEHLSIRSHYWNTEVLPSPDRHFAARLSLTGDTDGEGRAGKYDDYTAEQVDELIAALRPYGTHGTDDASDRVRVHPSNIQPGVLISTDANPAYLTREQVGELRAELAPYDDTRAVVPEPSRVTDRQTIDYTYDNGGRIIRKTTVNVRV